jgi:23S rRNA pseudouridine1911/1915/1917 synthase
MTLAAGPSQLTVASRQSIAVARIAASLGPMRSLTVPAGTAPLRLDVFLAQHVPNCSRRSAQRAIADGAVRINGRRAPKGQTLAGGDVVEMPDELYAATTLQPNAALAIPILYEDAAIIAIDKPAGMPSHALRADEADTVANFLLARHPELAAIGKSSLEAGVVHRLDTDTSGVLLAARSAAAYGALRRQFATHQVSKEYIALVCGDVAAPGEIRDRIAHDRRNRRRMRVCGLTSRAPARSAVTSYRPIERFGDNTLLAVQIATGVMHQIRVHLASIGHPIAGDRLYGGPPAPDSPSRHMLHASCLRVIHPSSGAPVRVSSPLPADFSALLEQLRQKQRASAGSTRKARRR